MHCQETKHPVRREEGPSIVVFLLMDLALYSIARSEYHISAHRNTLSMWVVRVEVAYGYPPGPTYVQSLPSLRPLRTVPTMLSVISYYNHLELLRSPWKVITMLRTVPKMRNKSVRQGAISSNPIQMRNDRIAL